MLCGISCELAGCLHRPIVDSEFMIAGWGQPNLSQLYLSQLSLAKLAKLNFFKTPASADKEYITEKKRSKSQTSSFIIDSDVNYKESLWYTVLRNRDVYPGSRIRCFSFRIPDQGVKKAPDLGSRIPDPQHWWYMGGKTYKEDASINWEHLKSSLSDTVCVSADEGLKRSEGVGEEGNRVYVILKMGCKLVLLRLRRLY